MKDCGIEWIGQIPDDWEVKRFKYIHSGTNVGESIDKEFWSQDENEYVFYTAGETNIYNTYNKFPNWKFVKSCDLLLARNGTPYVYLPPVDAQYSDHIIRTSINKDIDKRFVRYCLQLSIENEKVEVVSLATWSVSIWNEQKLPVPNITEQKLIADFLDKQTAKIDAIIKTNEEQLEVLKKYKKSLITQTVTKGLNKNARMKDSGIEWIGKIPEEWNVKHIKNHFSIISGSGFAIELQGKDFGDYPVCKAGDISAAGKELTSAANYLSKNEIKIAGFSIIPKGSIIFAKIGEAMKKNNRSINTIDCCLDNNCQGVIPHNFNSNYAYYVFLCIDMENYDNGGPIPCINNKKLLASKIPFPPVSEQQQIADYLDEKCLKIDSLISQKQQAIETMQKYKKSLIYEYVTGKKRIK